MAIGAQKCKPFDMDCSVTVKNNKLIYTEQSITLLKWLWKKLENNNVGCSWCVMG